MCECACIGWVVGVVKDILWDCRENNYPTPIYFGFHTFLDFTSHQNWFCVFVSLQNVKCFESCIMQFVWYKINGLSLTETPLWPYQKTYNPQPHNIDWLLHNHNISNLAVVTDSSHNNSHTCGYYLPGFAWYDPYHQQILVSTSYHSLASSWIYQGQHDPSFHAQGHPPAIKWKQCYTNSWLKCLWMILWYTNLKGCLPNLF